MADNYLEKRMEAYRSGRLAVSNRTSASMRSQRQAAGLAIKFPPLPLLVIADGADSDITVLLLARLNSLGCRVAFTGTDAPTGTELARQTGSRFYPPGFGADAIIADLAKAWRLTPVAIIDMRPGEPSSLPTDIRVIPGTRCHALAPSPEAAVNAIALLAHPDYAFLSAL